MWIRHFIGLTVMGTALGMSSVRAEDCTGKVQAEWLEDGRKMLLLADYSYVDPPNVEWKAAKGTVVDGASIPRFAWTAIGGPYEGKYRKASVAHDAAVDEKARPWQQVHRMFYDHMLCSGVNKSKAQAMYWAVFHCGPRWPGDEVVAQWCSSEDATKWLEQVAGRLTANPVAVVEQLQGLDPRSFPSGPFAPALPRVSLKEPADNSPDFLVAPKSR